jgi:hypothetical protein
MAQTGFTPILIYGSGTATTVPSASNLTNSINGAELAINYADGKLFYKDGSGNVQVIASKASASTTISFGTTGLTPSTASTGAITVAGTLNAANGGTGVAGTLTGILYGNGTSAHTVATTAQVLSLIGTLPVANGGTGLTSYTANGVVYANSSSTLTTGSALTFDGTNLTLGSGSTTPALKLSGANTSGAGPYLQFLRGGTQTNLIGPYSSVVSGTSNDLTYYSTTGYGHVWFSNGQASTIGMQLDSSGNLGLGVTPSAWRSGSLALQIGNGQGSFEGISNAINIWNNLYRNSSNQFVYQTTSAAGLYSLNAGVHEWFNAPSGTAGTTATLTQAMTLDASGNLGIGTTSPNNKLTVSGSGTLLNVTNPSGASFQVSCGAGSAYLQDASTGNGNYIQLNTAGNQMMFATNAAERMRIDSSGKVGIGTSSPSTFLQIGSATANANAIITLGKTTSTTEATLPTIYCGSLINAGAGLDAVIEAGSSTGGVALRTGGSTRAVVDASGYVGIGTTSPGGPLDVTNGASPPSRLRVGVGGGAAGTLYSTLSAGNYVSFETNSTERMRIDSSGNVGIGTNSPSASAILDAQSTTKGVRMPNMTTTQKNAIASPAAGLMVFDTTLSKLCVYTGSAWQTITSI